MTGDSDRSADPASLTQAKSSPERRAGDSAGHARSSRALKRWFWIVAGLLLMALAVWFAVRRGGLEHAIESLGDAGVPTVAALLLLPVASWVLTATLFWALTRRFGVVRWTEMCALIGASWLLNNLPMRPGMLGRVAYHRLVNGIPVRASVRVMIEALLCSAVAGAACVAVVAAIAGHVPAALGVAAVGVGGAAAGSAALKRRGTPLPLPLLMAGTAIRFLDIAGWAVRYWLLLRLAGAPATVGDAMGVTIAAMLASLTPVQFGLREWAVGSAASLTGQARDGGALLSMGLAADVLNRGVELLLAIPIGVTAVWVLSRRVRRAPKP